MFLRNQKLSLPNVTLVAVTGIEIKKAMYALWRSQIGIEFNRVLLITDSRVIINRQDTQIRILENYSLNSIDAYSKFIVFELYKYIETDFVLIVQADGYVLNPKKWRNEFTDYDYIGAPWRIREDAYIDPFGKHQRVGNGGFSLRSRKLLEIPLTQEIMWNVNDSNFYKHMGVNSQAEDGVICIHNRHIYEKFGIKFAPLELAMQFSCEQKVDEFNGELTFGFHKNFPSLRDRLFDKLLKFFYFLKLGIK